MDRRIIVVIVVGSFIVVVNRKGGFCIAMCCFILGFFLGEGIFLWFFIVLEFFFLVVFFCISLGDDDVLRRGRIYWCCRVIGSFWLSGGIFVVFRKSFDVVVSSGRDVFRILLGVLFVLVMFRFSLGVLVEWGFLF